MMKSLLLIAAFALIATPALAVTEYSTSFEDCCLLCTYLDIDVECVSEPVHTGNVAVHMTDQAASGTPYLVVAWITGLLEGDEVYAEFWTYDTTPGASPSNRIWGHYTGIGETDPCDYAGSAGGNSAYGDGTGWSLLSYTFTYTDPAFDRGGLSVEARSYSVPGDETWVDDVLVRVPDYATVIFCQANPVDDSTWGKVKALYR
jgi:hypothetical protein